MVVYNRRKRTAWMADQIRHNEELVTGAIANEKAGLPLTEDQELALNNERARFEAEERRKAKPGIGKWLLTPFEGLVGGLKASESGEDEVVKEEGGGIVDRVGQRVYEVEQGMVDGLQKVEGEVADGVRRAERNLKEAVAGNLSSGGKQAEGGVLAAVHEAGGQPRGGPLDRMAEQAVESGKQKVEKVKGGWGSWFGGKWRRGLSDTIFGELDSCSGIARRLAFGMVVYHIICRVYMYTNSPTLRQDGHRTNSMTFKAIWDRWPNVSKHWPDFGHCVYFWRLPWGTCT